MSMIRFFRTAILFSGFSFLFSGAAAPIFGQSSPAAMNMFSRLQQNILGGSTARSASPAPASGAIGAAQGPNSPNGGAAAAEVSEPVKLIEVKTPTYSYKKHTAAVTSLAISREGYACLSGSADSTAQIWRIRDLTPDETQPQSAPLQEREQAAPPVNFKSEIGKRLALFTDKHRQGVTSVAISPFEDFVFTASYDYSIRRWTIETEDSKKRLTGAKDRLWRVAVSPDGEVVAGACNDGIVYFWNPYSGKKISSLKASEGPIFDAEFSPNGSHLVTAGADGTANVFRSSEAKSILTLTGHKGRIYSAVFSPDGRYILTAGQDKTARIWDAASGKELCRIIGHEGSVRQAIFLNEDRIATCGDDKTVRVWSTTLNFGNQPAVSGNSPVNSQGYGLFSNFQNESEEDEESADPGLADSLFGEDAAPAEPQGGPAEEPSGPIERAVERIRFTAPDAVFAVAGNNQSIVGGCKNGEILLWDVTKYFAPPANPNAQGGPGQRQRQAGQGW